MKRLVAAACLAFTPLAARAEHGTQLSQWSDSSPRHEGEPAPAAAAAAPAAAAPEATVKKDEAQAKGPATVTAVTTPEQLANVSGFTVQASLDHALGQGTFIDASKYAFLGASVDLALRYSFKVAGIKLGTSARGYFAYEYTLSDAPNGRRYAWRDLSFGLSAPAVYKEQFTGISITPSLSFIIPITLESWQASTITVLSAGLNLTRSVGLFDFSLAVSASRGFHQNPLNAVRAKGSVDPTGYHKELSRQGETIAGVNGTNNAWSLSGSLAVTFRATDTISFDASYGLRAGWRYNIVPAGDPNQSQVTYSDGSGVCADNCRSGDLVLTSVSANYQISEHWGASLSISTAMPPKTSDGKNFRFPFWSFEGAANNYSSLGLSLQASF